MLQFARLARFMWLVLAFCTFQGALQASAQAVKAQALGWPDAEERVGDTAWVAQPVAYTFEEPSGPIFSQLRYATAVRVLEQRDGFARIQQNGVAAWIAEDQLARGEQLDSVEATVVVVTSLAGQVFATPSMHSAPPAVTVPYGTSFRVVVEDDPRVADLTDRQRQRYTAVHRMDGSIGFVRAGDLAEALPEMLGSEGVLERAKLFLGRPYTWGGNTSFGMDCSGFTQLIAKHRGIHLPHYAGPQMDHPSVTRVAENDLQAGDFVYFKSLSSGVITHCGIYMGDGRMIHATASGRPCVKIEDFTTERWQARFTGAIRLP